MHWYLGKSLRHLSRPRSSTHLIERLDTGTIGPVTTMPTFVRNFGNFSAAVHGVIVSSILLSGLLMSLIGGILADRHGRPRIIGVGSFVFGIGAALETTSVQLAMFIVGRLIKGIGEGMFLMTVYVYIAEISPAERRGTVANIPQIMISSGIVLGFFICYGTAEIAGSLSWRLPLAIQAGIAFMNATACFLVPQSPRWLLAKGQRDQAQEIISQLGIAHEEQIVLFQQSVRGLEHSVNETFLQSVRHAFRDFGAAFEAPVRGRTIFGCFILAMQQFSGIDGILYYAPILFRQAGLSSTQASFLASGVSALVMMAVTIPATLWCDSWGRKTASLVGGVSTSFFMLLVGSLYAAGKVYGDRGAARWVVIVSIYLWAVAFSITWALCLRMYLIESLPRKTRSSGASLAQASNWLANYTVALTTPVFLARSSFGAYYFFASSTVLCTVVCAFVMVETKGHSLEYIEQKYAERQTVVKQFGRWRKHETQSVSLREISQRREVKTEGCSLANKSL
ncbi:general substrate transporter [Xylariaceae sp. FL0016]|nr:general substrate transporter [Xylariaceae sp. FL0016]